MANITWSILNLVMLLGVFYTFFRAAKLIKQHIGLGAALFFGFGLLAISGNKSNDKSPEQSAKNLLSDVPEDAPLGNASAQQKIDLGGNTLHILAEYHQQNGFIKPRGLFVTVSGVVMGHRWHPMAGTLNQRGQGLYYRVVVRHEWYLLDLLVYSSGAAVFTGLMPKSDP